MGEIRDELEGRQLPTGGKRKSSHYLYRQTHQMKNKRKMPKPSFGLRLLGAKVTEGIRVNDLKLNIFEMKKEYEVHAMFENDENIKHRLDVARSYVGDEGYFDNEKEVKVYGKAWGQRTDE